jgi:hypothetical protein
MTAADRLAAPSGSLPKPSARLAREIFSGKPLGGCVAGFTSISKFYGMLAFTFSSLPQRVPTIGSRKFWFVLNRFSRIVEPEVKVLAVIKR